MLHKEQTCWLSWLHHGRRTNPTNKSINVLLLPNETIHGTRDLRRCLMIPTFHDAQRTYVLVELVTDRLPQASRERVLNMCCVRTKYAYNILFVTLCVRVFRLAFCVPRRYMVGLSLRQQRWRRHMTLLCLRTERYENAKSKTQQRAARSTQHASR